MDEVFERVRSVVAMTLNLPEEQVGPQTSPKTVEAWDSMGHLNVVLALEQEFGVQLPPEEVERMHDVAAAVELVRAHL